MAQTHRSIRLFREAKHKLIKWIAPVYHPGAKHRVVMFHCGRCGSTVLGRMLGKHPSLHWTSEVMNKRRMKRFIERTGQSDFREVIQASMFESWKPWYGCEVKGQDAKHAGTSISEVMAFLMESGFEHFIFLERSNYLRKHTSYRIAKSTGRFHLEKGQKKAGPSRIVLDVDEMRAALDTTARQHEMLRNVLADVPHLSLRYEDDIQSDPKVAYGKVCEYLGLSHYPQQAGLQRINPQKLRDLIINYDEVCIALKGSQYKWMVDE